VAAEVRARLLDSTSTALNACSLEACPLAPHEDLIVCGTYELDEATGKRQGLLELYQLRAAAGEGQAEVRVWVSWDQVSRSMAWLHGSCRDGPWRSKNGILGS
jgi:hypothetical protein